MYLFDGLWIALAELTNKQNVLEIDLLSGLAKAALLTRLERIHIHVQLHDSWIFIGLTGYGTPSRPAG